MKEPPAGIHSAYSTGAGPDCVVHNATASQHHELFELKIPSSISTGHSDAAACCCCFLCLCKHRAKANQLNHERPV
eukprot:6214373-Pleurochrysis_carterae.AAC.9